MPKANEIVNNLYFSPLFTITFIQECKVFVKPDISYLMLFRFALFKQENSLSYNDVIEWIRSNFTFYQQMDLES